MYSEHCTLVIKTIQKLKQEQLPWYFKGLAYDSQNLNQEDKMPSI